MDSKMRWRPSPSLVISFCALFISLSGLAVALPGRGSVKHDDLAAHVVHTGKIHQGAVTGGKLAPSAAVGQNGFGYVWANNATAASYTPSPSYSFNSEGGNPTIARSGTGTYQVTFPGLDLFGGSIQVTMYGSDNGSCHVVSWGSTTVNVECRDASGALADRFYTVLAIDNE